MYCPFRGFFGEDRAAHDLVGRPEGQRKQGVWVLKHGEFEVWGIRGAPDIVRAMTNGSLA